MFWSLNNTDIKCTDATGIKVTWFGSVLQLGRSNRVDPVEWLKPGLLNWFLGIISSVLLTKNRKTQRSSLHV